MVLPTSSAKYWGDAPSRRRATTGAGEPATKTSVSGATSAADAVPPIADTASSLDVSTSSVAPANTRAPGVPKTRGYWPACQPVVSIGYVAVPVAVVVVPPTVFRAWNPALMMPSPMMGHVVALACRSGSHTSAVSSMPSSTMANSSGSPSAPKTGSSTRPATSSRRWPRNRPSRHCDSVAVAVVMSCPWPRMTAAQSVDGSTMRTDTDGSRLCSSSANRGASSPAA